MFKKPHLFLLLLLLLAVFGCNHFVKEPCDPEQALADDAAVVVFSKDGDWMLRFMDSGFPLFSSETGGLIFPDSVKRAEVENEVRQCFGKRYFLSMYERAGVGVTLLAFELNETRERKIVELVKKINRKTGDVPSQKYHDVRCYTLVTEKGTCYFAVKDAVFLASTSLLLLQEAIDNVDVKNGLRQNEHYRHATQLWGRNVNANIYISYSKVAACSDVSSRPIFKELEEMALWSSFDMSKRDNIWILNGYTNVPDHALLKTDTSLQPIRMDVAAWLPTGTGCYYARPDTSISGGAASSLKRTSLYSQIFPLMDETCDFALYHHSGGQALSLQLSAVDDLFYSKFIIAYHIDNHPLPVEKPEQETASDEVPTFDEEPAIISTDGKIVLDGKMILSPFIFVNESAKKLNVILFDDKKNVYLIEKERGVIFKKTLDELPVSRVYEIDDGGGKKYVFNSKNRLYVIDSKGDAVQGFPLLLSVPAQNSVAVFDFHGKKDYSIVWVDANGTVQCVDKTGKKRQDWSSPVVSGEISQALQYCSKGNAAYLIAALDNGNVMLYDRQGKEKMTIKSSFHNNPRTAFYINETNYQKGLLLTTDKTGTLVYLPEKGKISTTVFGTFSEQHQFLYGDLDGDGHRDFIYLDKNELKVFNRFKKQILKHTFPKNTTLSMELFTLNKKKYIAVSALEENKIYLFDGKGIDDLSSWLIID